MTHSNIRNNRINIRIYETFRGSFDKTQDLKMDSLFLLLLASMTSFMLVGDVSGQGLNIEDSDFIEDVDCFNNICDDNKHLVCDSDRKKCRCDVEHLWKGKDGKCVKKEELYQKCGDSKQNPDIECAVPGSVCVIDDFSEPRMSCLCNTPEYVDIKNPGLPEDVVPAVYRDICAKVLPRGVKDDANGCDVCNPEASKCYGLPVSGGGFNDKRNGCRCDVSFSGENCEKEHVSVSCNITERKMDICYLPHADVDVSNPVKIYVTKLYDKSNCRGSLVTGNNNKCNNGSYLLSVSLPVNESSENTCETQMTQQDQMRRFENTIQVEKGGSSTESHVFTVYCQYEHSTFRSAGFIVKSSPTNNRGESLIANVSMSVLDSTNKPLGDNPRIHTKDKIKFQVQLNVDDTYGALLPTYCTASPYGSRDSPKGINLNQQLVIDGCPVSSLPDINQMKFKKKNGQANVMITDEMNMIKLKVGDTVYVHCKVKLCLRGSEQLCDMPTCSSRRRKRAAENDKYAEEDTDVKLTFIDDDNYNSSGFATITMTTMGFAIIISLLVALVVVIVTVLVVLVLRLRARGNKVNDTVELTDKPQRFALPRITRNHLRI